MTDHLPAFTIQSLALIWDWLRELVVFVESLDDNYVRTNYIIRSMQDLRLLVLQEAHHHKVEFTITRGPMFSLRGIANKDLLEQALEQFPNGYALNTASFAYYPESFDFLDQYMMLLEAFAGEWGHPMMFGPPAFPDSVAALEADESLIVRCYPDKQSVLFPSDLHHNIYDRLIERLPAHYQWIEEMWRE
jgi:hypothetical protein